MSSLIHCIYASRVTPLFHEYDIPVLLEKARAANGAQTITGILLYVDGSFFQVLEGEPEAVDAVYRMIERDPRHTGVSLIIREPITERDFGSWTMGFTALARAEIEELLGENDFFGAASCLTDLGPGRSKKLLSAFRNGRWRADQTGAHRELSRTA